MQVKLQVTLPISLWEIVMHLRFMHIPILQVPVVRVLWMVPIYAVDSWLALRFSWTEYKDISTYICVARECYEAFVVYNFFIFLARFVAISAVSSTRRPQRFSREQSSHSTSSKARLSLDRDNVTEHSTDSRDLEAKNASDIVGVADAAGGGLRGETADELSQVYLHGERADVRAIEARLRAVLARKAPIAHIFPLNLVMQPWATSSTAHHDSCEYYRRVKGGVTQYVVVKLGCALAAFVLKPLNLWGEGSLQAFFTRC